MLGTYLQLQIERQRARRRASVAVQLLEIVKFLVLLRLTWLAVWYGLIDHRFLDAPILLNAVRDGTVARLVLAVGVLLAHFQLQLTTPLAVEPFIRFMRRRAWLLRSYTYPMVSSPMVVALLVALALLHARGALYFSVFYLAYLLSWRRPIARVPLLVLVFGSTLMHWGEGASLAWAAVVFGGLVVYDARDLGARFNRDGPERGGASARPVLAKEFAAWRRFSSDQVYTGLSLALVALLAWALAGEAQPEAGVDLRLWLIPWLSALPFARILFNLFGTDMAAFSRFARWPEATIRYEMTRLRAYQFPIYSLQAVILWRARAAFTSSTALVTYILGSIAFTEMLIFAALLYSVVMRAEKEERYRFGQQFTANVQLTILVHAGLTLIVIAAVSFGGLLAVGALACAAMYGTTVRLPRIARTVLDRQRVPSSHGR